MSSDPPSPRSALAAVFRSPRAAMAASSPSSSTLSPTAASPTSPQSPVVGRKSSRCSRCCSVRGLIRVGSFVMAVFNFVQLCHSTWLLSRQVTVDVVSTVADVERSKRAIADAAQRNFLSRWIMNGLFNEEQLLQEQLMISYRNIALLAGPLILGSIILFCCGNRCTRTADGGRTFIPLMRNITVFLAVVSIVYQLVVGTLTLGDAGGYMMILFSDNVAIQTVIGLIFDLISPCLLFPFIVIYRRCCTCCTNCCCSCCRGQSSSSLIIDIEKVSTD